MVHFTQILPFRLILATGQRLCVDMTRCDLLLTRWLNVTCAVPSENVHACLIKKCMVGDLVTVLKGHDSQCLSPCPASDASMIVSSLPGVAKFGNRHLAQDSNVNQAGEDVDDVRTPSRRSDIGRASLRSRIAVVSGALLD